MVKKQVTFQVTIQVVAEIEDDPKYSTFENQLKDDVNYINVDVSADLGRGITIVDTDEVKIEPTLITDI